MSKYTCSIIAEDRRDVTTNCVPMPQRCNSIIKPYFYMVAKPLVFLGVVLTLLNGCQRSVSYQSINVFAKSGNYNQVLNRLDNHDWSNEENPALMMLYTEALVESGLQLPRKIFEKKVPAMVRDFFVGYYN